MPETLSYHKLKQIEEINNSAASASNSLVDGNPAAELIAWAQQILETNGVVPQKTIAAIALAEGVDESVVIARVKTHGASFMFAGIIDKRMRLLTQVESITDPKPDAPSEETIAAIQAVVW